MKITLLTVTLMALALLPSAASAATCADYSNQRDAQRAADTRDADADGIYCESLPCPCSSGGSPSPPPPPSVQPSCSRPSTVQRIDLLTGKTRVSSAPSSRRSQPRASASAEGREDKIIAVLGKNPDGVNGKAIAEEIGTAYQTAKKTLDAMVEAGTIKRTGEKRGTKYLPA